MTHDPLISKSTDSIALPGELQSTPALKQTGTQGAAFKTLLEKLENEARDLRQASEGLGPAELSGAVDRARSSLDDALSLGDQLLEAYRASQHQRTESDE